ncbi:ERC protein 2 isoform X1 [Corvus cornix cornix]|uniref:ERC protein 2 n=1 Tax=Corvus hawaiiensis TaxID=134902 RepID=UPI0005349066|nr:PREDICTED: ERC protein 2 isoform X1 [Corvus brachyrhynchos]XP_017587912.1 PREDICTED: ERC protein 2 isoform X1 [Corvus brachyrhynchos]XP_017587913.1 PREDICTED: ERC protein 2 isoform X1 [Corvus brachyrhynchos]XP_017587914.1 PREDICTED: ERC protein 2 isoform X1 [Corvus brachyrhynchos]XP_039414820.1 ERC protein 2 isoform X1 [Corvus cornix cornix]XP_039414821.1 ERC protein 2 isoform X1 [Corvus cornix cornix]XP_039414822.1 ERC protein 2 isoform X1 [Corvus cornix cornix]XP_048171270.1 ERC protein
MYGSARTISNLEGSPSRSPRLPRSPRLGHRRTSSGGGGTGKTLSMENIQSLNAAYATSGPMYLSDHEGVASTTFPKGTMTLGRATNRAVYGGRVTAMGSSPNIASAGLSHTDVLSYTDQHGGLTTSSHHHHHQVPSMLRQVRDSTMLDLQAQLKDLQRENDLLRKELDIKDSKLGSSMNSIKTFWSPELKKERVLRKEEAARMSVLKEQMRVSHEENQFLDARRTKHLQLTIQALQDELRTQRDLNHLLQQESGNRGAEHFTIELTEENFRRLQAEHDRQAKELFLLRKTLEEMELRIETQKQTLNARDESIKKLLEMLQSKGLPSKGMEDDNERTRRMAEAESQVNHLEVILDQKEKENMHLREELHRRTQLQPEPAKTKALQTVIEMKDTKIASLERNIRDLEDEIQMLKTNGVLNTEDREEEIKQIEVYKSHSKFMKNKIDQLKQELSKKESELLALQTKLETLSNQNSDCKQHIEVLKESLTAKEQRAAILQTEVDALRLRLEEKETFLNKKTKQLQDLTEEKGTLAGEIRDMKDMLEVKERKINVLQKKIENLQEQLRDKDKQLTNLKDRVKSLQTDSSNTDTALATLEEALSEKERIIERLKEQRDRDDRERLEEIESYKKENKDLKEKVNALQAELTEKESSLIDLKEHASSLASAGLKRDSKLKSLEIAIEQKKEECSKLEAQLKKQAEQLFNQMYNPMPIRNNGKQGAHEAEEEARMNPEFADRMKQLDKEASYYREECGKAQAEVDRLLEILKEVENEKNDKDKKIAELESLTSRHMKDQSKKVANLKHNQQLEKKKNAQLLEEVRRREDNMTDNSQHLQVEELMNALEKTRQELDSTKARLASTQQSLAEKEAHLANLRIERRKQLEEILEMKQEALLAAISEKDANIALLELSASKKKKTQDEVMALKREKDRLVHQLKQQTQNRMKLMADNYDDDHHHYHHHHHHHHHRSPGRTQHNHRPSPDQDDEEGIWA